MELKEQDCFVINLFNILKGTICDFHLIRFQETKLVCSPSCWFTGQVGRAIVLMHANLLFLSAFRTIIVPLLLHT